MIYILPTDTCYGIACAFHDRESYEKIYKIKKRDTKKALAIMVKSFEWLEKNTQLTPQQIDFLKNYERPFTILTDSIPMRLYLEFEDENGEHFMNKNIYEYISFRVATTKTQKKLLSEIGPIWLTSANMSNAGETYRISEIEKDFSYYLEKGDIKILEHKNLDAHIAPSDVFRFVDDTLEIEYIRKS